MKRAKPSRQAFETLERRQLMAIQLMPAAEPAAVSSGNVSGFVFNDLTDNGPTSDDRPVAGITVFADVSKTGVLASGDPSAVSTNNGSFLLTGVPTGSVTIREVLSPTYTVATGNGAAQTVAVSSTTTVAVSFDNFTQGQATGYVYFGATVTAPAAPSSPVANATVYEDINHSGAYVSGDPVAYTSSTGAYHLYGLAAGTDYIGVVDPSGYIQGVEPSVSVQSGSVDTLYLQQTVAQSIVQLSGTAIGTAGSYDNDGNTIGKATDGSLTTFFDGPTASGDWVGLDLGVAQVATTVKFASRSGFGSRMNGGQIQASTSATFGSGVVTLYTIGSSANPSSTSLTSESLNNTTAYRYYRYLAPANSYGNIAEFQLFGAPTVVAPTKLSGTVTGTAGSYQNDGDTIADAVDGNLNTFFDGPTASGNIVALTFGSAQTITDIAYAPRAGYSSRMIGGVFQASSSSTFSTGVVNLLTITTAPAAGVLTTVALGTPVTDQYVRYVSPTGSYGNIAEMVFYG